MLRNNLKSGWLNNEVTDVKHGAHISHMSHGTNGIADLKHMISDGTLPAKFRHTSASNARGVSITTLRI